MTTRKPKYLTKPDQIPNLSADEREDVELVCDKFLFRSNEYYMGLINWEDPNDPIRKISVPDIAELRNWGAIDASDESHFAVVPGLEHKYDDTVVLLVNDVCGAYCRFCFRKRLFMDGESEISRDVTEGLAYIRAHTEINNVLLTGGDPLLMSTRRLEDIVRQLREIDHVGIVRIGSKMPAFNPFRIIDDPDLLRMFSTYSTGSKRIYVMVHFNHPRELTPEARQALAMMQEAGAILTNQTPLIRGVNDDPDVLEDLFNELSFIGVPPYYVFQCRPTLGNKPFSVPIEEAYGLFLEAQTRCAGLAGRARFVMSHATGKVEVVGMDDAQIYMRYHRAADPEDAGRFLAFDRMPEAYWLDAYLDSEIERRKGRWINSLASGFWGS
jgi:lysine 2,3-aminomutase